LAEGTGLYAPKPTLLAGARLEASLLLASADTDYT
jgi:hypothetical protein